MNEELILQTLMGHTERLEQIEENMATKQDIAHLMEVQDKMIGILERVDQEPVFTNIRMERFEEDLKKVKIKVGMYE